MLYLLLKTIWLLIPAYTPNNFAVVFGGGIPIDLGKNFVDGKRILGDGKTIRGFIFGVLGGILCGTIQFNLENFLGIAFFSSLSFPDAFVLVSSLSFGSLSGDLLGSFIKRRIGIKRGQALPFFDQLTFLVVAFLFAYTFSPFFHHLFTIKVIVAAIIITPILHLLTNYIAFKLGLKDVPW
jgi:CDP-2,3-bis-(O-geranylgeranyl)-sn-glycerol synthase